jgi:minichromosome maintenance protein 10
MELPALRSSGFRERVPTPSSASGLGPAPAPGPSSCTAAKGKGKAGDDDELEIVRTGNERNDDLTVATELPMGPGEFGLDPEGEEVWRALEPNSGIRLA